MDVLGCHCAFQLDFFDETDWRRVWKQILSIVARKMCGSPRYKAKTWKKKNRRKEGEGEQKGPRGKAKLNLQMREADPSEQP